MSKKRHHQHLFQLIASIKSEKEAQMLLTDLFTPQELEDLADRWQLIQLLASGMPQRDIARKMNISISKITRGSTALKHGEGGFEMFLRRKRK